MTHYILRRLLLIVPTLLGITIVVFFTMALSPGGIGASLLTDGGEMSPSERKALTDYYDQRYGLDKPIAVQYLNWLNHVSPIGLKPAGDGFPVSWNFGFKAPNLGESFALHRPVAELILERLPITLLLNLFSIPLIYSISIYVGIRAARKRGQVLDVASGTIFLGMWSFPSILAGVLMIGYLANREHFQWFPTAGLHDPMADSMAFLPSFSSTGFQRGWLLDTCWHLVLPVICLSYGGFAFLAKLSRGSILENISSDYVRTARAKGTSERDVLYRHVLRNSLLPLITVSAGIIPGLIAGSVIVESIFNLEGMGKLAVDGVFMRDRELVLSVTFISGILGLLAYLLADICYAIADPRVSYE